MHTRPPPSKPVSSAFELELVAPAEDVDELGHVSNVAIVRWVQDAAKAHSAAVGWDHASYLRLGAVFVVRRHVIEYLAPVYGGDRVKIATWIASWSAATSERVTRIENAGDGRAIAHASTLWAMVATASGRPRRIPAEVVEAFTGKP